MKMNTSLGVFDEENFELLEKSKRERKPRQLIIGAGALILGGIIGAVGNYLHEGQVIDVLEKKQGLIIHQIEDNLVKLNQEEQDLKLISTALNDTILYTEKLNMGIRSLNKGQQYLRNFMSYKLTLLGVVR